LFKIALYILIFKNNPIGGASLGYHLSNDKCYVRRFFDNEVYHLQNEDLQRIITFFHLTQRYVALKMTAPSGPPVYHTHYIGPPSAEVKSYSP
jgi:hypothetical protein